MWIKGNRPNSALSYTYVNLTLLLLKPQSNFTEAKEVTWDLQWCN